MSCQYTVQDKTTKRMRKCRKKPMSAWHDCTYCYAHWHKVYRTTHDNATPPNIWESLGFAHDPPLDTMRPSNASALASLLRRGPDMPTWSDAVTPASSEREPEKDNGHIYVYKLAADDARGDPWYKIGRTKHAPQKRLAQWPGSMLVQAWPVPPNMATFAESIIHRWLEYWRAYRFLLPMGKQKPGQHKRYLSVWYQPIQDDAHAKPHYNVVPDWVAHGYTHNTYRVRSWLPESAYTVLDNGQCTLHDVSFYPKSRSKKRYTVENEWFFCKWEYIERVIDDVCKVVRAFETTHRRMIQSALPIAHKE